MLRLIGRRLLLMIPTLILVSILIFALAEVFVPGSVGRSILGPYATEEQVQLLNEKLGADKPVVVRYVTWAGGFVTGDWGESALLEVPVRPLVMDAFWNSLLLAGFALVLIVPTSIALGVFAGLRRDSVLDRTITVSSLSMTVIPEFVSGVVLLYVFAVWLKWLPVTALPPDGAPFYERLYYLILPAIPLMFLELGYIARMARVGTVQVLSMPYIRTAVLKGVPRSRVVFGHVLRNAMVPTVTVIGSQVGLAHRRPGRRREAVHLPGHRPAHGRLRPRARHPAARGVGPPGGGRVHGGQPDRRHRRRAAQPADPDGRLTWTRSATPRSDPSPTSARRRWSSAPTPR